MNAPLPPNEAQRLVALRHYAVLDTLPEASFDDLAELASHICQTPIAVISLIDENRQWFKARVGLDMTETTREMAFCAHAILQPTEVLEVSDACTDPRFSSNPLVTGDPRLRFYAGAPLVTPDGYALGTICALDHQPRTLDDQQRKALRALSRQVVAQLELRRYASVLAREAEERKRIEFQLRQQLDELATRKVEADRAILKVQQSRRALLSVVEDQKRTAVSLRETEERYRLALSGANDAVWDWDVVNHRIFFSPRWKEIRGLTDVEVSDREEEWSGGIHPEDSPRVFAAVEAHFAGTTELFAEEYRVRHKDGSWIWILDRGQARRDAAGKVVRMTGSETDITARKVAEQSLKLFRTLIDQASDAIEVVDPETGRFLDMNVRGCQELGYTREEVTALTTDEVDPTGGLEGFPRFVARLRESGLINTETQHRRKDGTMFPVEIASRIVRLEREYIVTMARDITARKAAEAALRESEARYQRVMLGTSEGLWEWKIETGKQYCSPRWMEMLGYDPTETVQDYESFLALIHPDDVAPVMATTEEAIREHRPYRAEMRLRRKDGSYLWVLSRAIVDYGPDAKPMTMTGSIADLTATREIEQQLRQSQKLEAIGTLAGGIAHDFNNILSGIYGYTSLARWAANGNQQLLDYLGEIDQAGRRAAELVQQILTFSRNRGDDDHMELIPLDRIVHEAVRLLRAASPATVAFQVHAAPLLPTVKANPSQLHQVVMNLGTNAIHAMRNRPDAQLSLRLETFTSDEALVQQFPNLTVGPYVRLTIRDNGHGMDVATQARVFEPFFTTKGPGEGTGLGLSVVHGIIRNHHGAIRLTSDVGRGTAFEIFLPASAIAHVEPSPEAAEVPRGRGERILLVDDEPAIVIAGEMVLTQLGYQAVGETSVLAALDRLEREPHAFDLVLSDQTMPAMSGLTLAGRIRSLRPNLPVVIASGHSDELTASNIKAAGVREVLSKPYSLEQLAAAVRRQLP